MKHRPLFSLSVFCAAAAAGFAASARPDLPLPNIVLILADDLGYGDTGCYNPNSRAPTPRIDSLARDGMRFTNFYSPDAVCTPSRYNLMAGRYSWRTTHRRSVQLNWEKPLINEGRTTLPSLLKDAGYTTGGFGKWHLGADFPTIDGLPPVGQGGQRHELDGANLDLTVPMRGGPMARGFDRWFGFICASESFIFDDLFATACIDVYPRPKAKGAEQLRHLPLANYLPEVTDKALEFIGKQAAAAKQGKPFFLHYAPYVPHLPLAVSEAYKGKTKGGDYGDYVHELDFEVGRVLDALERQGLSENTLVLFLSDNGSQFETTGEGHRPNAPLSGIKTTLLEGGVRVPLIVRWPKHVGAGTVSHDIAASTDLLATMAALTRKTLPPNAGEDSFDLTPILLGNPQGKSAREFVIVKAVDAHLAIRQGRWKFVSQPEFPWVKQPATGQVQEKLYDLEADLGETKNVIADHPEIAAGLRQKLLLAVESPGTVPSLLKE